MKRLVLLAAATGLLLPFALTEPAAAGHKGVKKSHAYKVTKPTRRYIRRSRKRRAKVRGFTARVGGYSFVFEETLRIDPETPPPVDFGPYHDGYRVQGGIINTSPYP